LAQASRLRDDTNHIRKRRRNAELDGTGLSAGSATAPIRGWCSPTASSSSTASCPSAWSPPFAIGVIAAIELREGRFIELVLFWGTLLLVSSPCTRCCTWATGAIATRSRRRRSGCAGWASAPSPPARSGVSPGSVLSLALGRAPGVPRLPAVGRALRRHSEYAASWPIFAAYAAAIAFSAHLRAGDLRQPPVREIALLIPLFYGSSVAIAYRLNGVFFSGYRLRHAYGKLTEDYSVLNQRLERQLVELEEARRQVEASGRKLLSSPSARRSRCSSSRPTAR